MAQQLVCRNDRLNPWTGELCLCHFAENKKVL
jgi:hypothetical protein